VGGALVMSLTIDLQKRLSEQFTLSVGFDAAPGVTIVFGESGSGKTTLLRCVAGLDRPDSGTILLGGRVLFDSARGIDVDPPMRTAGFVFQHLALFPHLTAADNIQYGIAGIPADARRRQTIAIAESFRIAHLLHRVPRQISGGERQRVALARSLVTNPFVLLLDEPLSALDHHTQSRIMEDLREWNEARRIPILYVTHSQREVFAIGDRVLVLQEGRIIADGTPQQVLETPSHEHVARLAGFENLIDAVVTERRPDAGVMTVRPARTNVDLETPMMNVDTRRAVRVAIRAGDILIATEHPRGLSARNVIPGRIVSLVREGAFVRASVTIGVPVEVHIPPSACGELGLAPDREVWLVIKTHSCRPVLVT